MTTPNHMVVNLEVSSQRIADTIVAAFEGGSRYWCTDVIDQTDFMPDPAGKDDHYGIWYADPAYWESDFKIAVRHSSAEDQDEIIETIVGRDDLKAGLHLMATKSPDYFADVIGDGGDASTGDVLWQYIVLKDVVFG